MTASLYLPRPLPLRPLRLERFFNHFDQNDKPNTHLDIIYSRESKSGQALYAYLESNKWTIVSAPVTDDE